MKFTQPSHHNIFQHCEFCNDWWNHHGYKLTTWSNSQIMSNFMSHSIVISGSHALIDIPHSRLSLGLQTVFPHARPTLLLLSSCQPILAKICKKSLENNKMRNCQFFENPNFWKSQVLQVLLFEDLIFFFFLTISIFCKSQALSIHCLKISFKKS